MNWRIGLIGILFLSGCGFQEAPIMKEYRLMVPSVTAVSSSVYRHQILKVSYPVALGEKLTEHMYYSYSFSDRGAYVNSSWSTALGRMLQGNMIQILSNAHCFKVVVPFASDIKENLRLESTVFDFSHHVRGEDSYAVVSIQFTLMDVHTGKLVKAKRFSYREATTTTNAKGYAQASNRIMVALSHDLVVWLSHP